MFLVGPCSLSILQLQFCRMSLLISMNAWGSLILFMAFSSMVIFTESKAAEISSDSIHSSFFVNCLMLYIEFSIWMGSKVLWLGSPAKLLLENMGCLERMLFNRFVII